MSNVPPDAPRPEPAGPPPAPRGTGPPVPPPPVGSDVPAWPPEPTRPPRRRWLIPTLIGAGVLVVAIVVAAAVSNRGGHDLPDRVGDLQRLHSAQVQALEQMTSQLKIGDLKIDVAGYGSGEDLQLVLIRYSNLPTQPPVSQVLRGAGGGIVGTGGTVDFDAMTSRLREGVEYTCLPFSGRMFPTDAADTNGQICAWAEGGDVAVVMDARTTDVDAAVADAAAAHAALSESG